MVALHFATATWREDDAVLWIVDCEAVHRLLPDALRASLEQEGSLVFKHAIDPAELDALVQDEPFALFFEPPSLDDRIVNQAAVLSVIADPQLQMDEWLAEHPDTFRGLRIPSELSARPRRRLDQAYITERLVTPGWTDSRAGSSATTRLTGRPKRSSAERRWSGSERHVKRRGRRATAAERLPRAPR
jgi:hypothetical protein